MQRNRKKGKNKKKSKKCSFLMFVKDDIAVILNETALAPDSPKGKADRGVVGMIVLAQDLLDMLSSFLSVIVWHG